MKLNDFIYLYPNVDGEVGVEVEVEGEGLPDEVRGWEVKDDGSLRGEGCEYVFDGPQKREDVLTSLVDLSNAYKEYDSTIRHSSRASIHVHINVRDLTITEIFNFITLFLIVEEPLVSSCGKGREGNLFCQRSIDSSGLFTYLKQAATGHFEILNNDRIRYSAINVASMFKFGSLEFRSMESTDDIQRIYRWVNLLLNLKDKAKTMKSPKDILSRFSELEPIGWVEDLLGENSHIVFNYSDWRKVLHSQVRKLQMMAFLGTWDLFSLDNKAIEE